MAKFFLLVIVLLLVFWWLFSQRKKPTDASSQQASTPTGERIVVCAQCQLHVPESESIVYEGRHYCCDEHRQRGPA
jgi:membrane protein implicated in regulation of membrane protease activity